jgi:imidazolonepropionase
MHGTIYKTSVLNCRNNKFDASCGMRLLIKNIQELFGTFESNPGTIKGLEMNKFPSLTNAWLAVEDGIIIDFGCMSEWPGITDWADLTIVDADGKMLVPCWCDSHTHTVFAKSRSLEFEDKINGLSYEEIARRGGGILNSAHAMSLSSEDQLFEDAIARVKKMMHNGTGALEIKTGYGLDVENELKMLRVIQRIKSSSPIPIKSTLIIGHALPADYLGRMDDYIQMLLEQLLPQAQEIGFDFLDIFCERDYFQVSHLEQLLLKSKELNKPAKIHVNQFYSIGGVEMATKLGALSLDHMEVISDQDWVALKDNPTIVTGLPGCSLFTKITYTPMRKLMDENIPVALATDFNPGSAPSSNMNLINSLACIQMNMKPLEVLAASCQNGAAAMQVDELTGSITPGKIANFIVTKPLERLSELFYYLGEDNIDQVYIKGNPLR